MARQSLGPEFQALSDLVRVVTMARGTGGRRRRRKVYKSSLAVGLSGLLEHAVILCSTELNNVTMARGTIVTVGGTARPVIRLNLTR